MNEGKAYQLDIKGDVLTLRTASFETGRGSILHPGIFGPELRAVLASAGAMLLIYLVLRPAPGLVNYLLLAAGFIAFFVIFKASVFYEPLLEAVIDKTMGTITVSVKKFRGWKDSYPLSDLTTVEMGHMVITPENPDGIRVVEKVALQHGTAIPGFGEALDLYTVEIKFRVGRSIVLFSTKTPMEAEALLKDVRVFLGYA